MKARLTAGLTSLQGKVGALCGKVSRGQQQISLLSIPYEVSKEDPSAAQEARRAWYAAKVQTWRAATDEQRAAWDLLGEPLNISGFNLLVSLMANDQTEINPDLVEAATLDSPITSLLSNLNRIRYWLTQITGEALGTVTHSLAATWTAVDNLSKTGNDTEVIFNDAEALAGDPALTWDKISETLAATFFAGDGSALENIGQTAATSLTFSAKEPNVAALKKGQAIYISGGSAGPLPTVELADNTVLAKTRAVGICAADINQNATGKIRRGGILTLVDTRATNLDVNPLGQTWLPGDLLFLVTGGGLSNVRPTSGRSVKVAFTLSGSDANDSLLIYPMENPVWISCAAGENVVLRLGDTLGVNAVSIRDYDNLEVASIDSYGNFDGNNLILKELLDANTIIKADTDDTPIALTIAEQRIVGRITAGSIAALSAAQVKTLLTIDHGADLAGLDGDDHTQYLLVDGTRAMTGALAMGTQKITGVVDPTADQEAATKKYVDDEIGAIPPGAGVFGATELIATDGGSQYPLAYSTTYVKATTVRPGGYEAHIATDPSKSLIGVNTGNCWNSTSGSVTNQRFHIDLGSAKLIVQIYYENAHVYGGNTNRGINNFTFWGSNTEADFLELDYAEDGTWVQITPSQNTFDQHVALDQADPKYITLTNSTAYRYYAIKIADNHGDATWLQVRRIELQIATPKDVTHGFGSEPDAVLITLTEPNEIATVTAKDGTTFTVEITRRSDGLPGTLQTVYWTVGDAA